MSFHLAGTGHWASGGGSPFPGSRLCHWSGFLWSGFLLPVVPSIKSWPPASLFPGPLFAPILALTPWPSPLRLLAGPSGRPRVVRAGPPRGAVLPCGRSLHGLPHGRGFGCPQRATCAVRHPPGPCVRPRHPPLRGPAPGMGPRPSGALGPPAGGAVAAGPQLPSPLVSPHTQRGRATGGHLSRSLLRGRRDDEYRCRDSRSSCLSSDLDCG
jgi:hypothetical protein